MANPEIQKNQLVFDKPNLLPLYVSVLLIEKVADLSVTMIEGVLNANILSDPVGAQFIISTERQIRAMFPLGQGLDQYGLQPDIIDKEEIANPKKVSSDNIPSQQGNMSKEYYNNLIELVSKLGYEATTIEKCTGVTDKERFRQQPYSYLYLKTHGYILAESFVRGNKIILIKIAKILPYLIQNDLVDIDFAASDEDHFLVICKAVNQMSKEQLKEIDGVSLVVHTDRNYTLLFNLIKKNQSSDPFKIKKLARDSLVHILENILTLLQNQKNNQEFLALINKYPEFFLKDLDGNEIFTIDILIEKFPNLYYRNACGVQKAVFNIYKIRFSDSQLYLISQIIIYLITWMIKNKFTENSMLSFVRLVKGENVQKDTKNFQEFYHYFSLILNIIDQKNVLKTRFLILIKTLDQVRKQVDKKLTEQIVSLLNDHINSLKNQTNLIRNHQMLPELVVAEVIPSNMNSVLKLCDDQAFLKSLKWRLYYVAFELLAFRAIIYMGKNEGNKIKGHAAITNLWTKISLTEDEKFKELNTLYNLMYQYSDIYQGLMVGKIGGGQVPKIVIQNQITDFLFTIPEGAYLINLINKINTYI